MNFAVVPPAKFAPARPRPRGLQRGTAVLIVLVLLACLALFITANSSALHTLKQELRELDQEQLKKYGTAR